MFGKIKKLAIVGIVLMCLSACDSGREYNGDFEVSNSIMVDNEKELKENFSDLKYKFIDKDNIIFEGNYKGQPFTYKAVVDGDIEVEKEIVDKSTNERYDEYDYDINAIEESNKNNLEISVDETVYSKNKGSVPKSV